MGLAVPITGDYYGCGWVVGASDAFKFDGRHELAPTPSPDFPVPFYRSIEGVGTRSVISAEPMSCELADSFEIGDEVALKARSFKVQNISAVSQLESEFPDGTTRTGFVASHLNAANFTMSIPADNCGVILRKTYDRFHGRQRARVHIDGVFAGWWYEPAEDRKRRWHISDFGVDASLTQGKTEIQITIDPPAGVALWSVGRMEVFALRGG